MFLEKKKKSMASSTHSEEGPTRSHLVQNSITQSMSGSPCHLFCLFYFSVFCNYPVIIMISTKKTKYMVAKFQISPSPSTVTSIMLTP